MANNRCNHFIKDYGNDLQNAKLVNKEIPFGDNQKYIEAINDQTFTQKIKRYKLVNRLENINDAGISDPPSIQILCN